MPLFEYPISISVFGVIIFGRMIISIIIFFRIDIF